MSEVVTFAALQAIISDFAAVMHSNADYLTRLDAVIGDGDHGRNMALGMEQVRREVLTTPPGPPGTLLRTTGMALVTTVGGASGPLYSAAFIAAGIAARSSTTLTLADLAHVARSAADALARRGRCHVGDKTILDALDPAAQALAQAVADERTLLYGLQAAAAAARRVMDATVPLVARCGLALQYGPASAGHADPGAASCALLWESALRTFRRLYPLAR